MIKLYNVYRKLGTEIPYLQSCRVLSTKDVFVTSSEEVGLFCKEYLNYERLVEERVFEICCNSNLQITGVFEVTKGSLTSAYVDVAAIFRNALLLNAANIILAHNHPSGDSKPSNADLLVTERLREAGDVIGIPVLEHIVLGKDEFWACSKQRRIKF